MTRPITLLALALVLPGGLAAQQLSGARVGLGVEYVFDSWEGSHLGPAVSLAAWGRGPLRVRLDASLLAKVGQGLDIACPSDFSTCDTRVMKLHGSSSLALELGTRDRDSNGGPFIAARAGVGAAYRGAGYVRTNTGPGSTVASTEDGYASALLLIGGEVGMVIPAFGRANRVSLRFDRLHEQDGLVKSWSLGFLRNW